MTSPELAAAAESAPPPSPLMTSYLRTFVPLIAGALLSLAARFGLDVNVEDLNGFLELLLAAAYYGLFRLLEAKVDPRFGWFLGKAATPMYADSRTLEGEVVRQQVEGQLADAGVTSPLEDFSQLGRILPMPEATSIDSPMVVVHVHNYGEGASIDADPPRRSRRKPATDTDV